MTANAGQLAVDLEDVVALCRATATARHWPYTAWQAVRDELDGAVIPGLPCQAQAGEVLTALTSHGLAAAQRPTPLRTEPRSGAPVGTHGSCADDSLCCSPVSMTCPPMDRDRELTLYHYDRHAAAAAATSHDDPDLDCHVSTDVETALRRSDPLPHTTPAINDIR
jgi:hypothetical protein